MNMEDAQLKIFHERKKKVSAVLYEVLCRCTVSPHVLKQIGDKIIAFASGKELMSVTRDLILSDITSLTDSIFMKESKLPDQFLSLESITKLFMAIQKFVQRLDHMGFCYTVSSQDVERERIIRAVSNTDWHLYEMESVDVAKWYFIGDRHNWQDPMIELLPVKLPHDLPEDLPYWMPHIHLDINTSLSADEIITMSKNVFGDTRTPILYTDPQWGTHCVRIWLGVVSGVNIHLDLSTKVRNLEWVRKNMLQKII